ncbi:MAG: CBS domain-containing protein [Thermoanaerobaculia bacterium]
MRVRDIMTTAIWSCSDNASVASAANTMRDHNCGFVPVVTGDGGVAGVLTDRDICMALVRKDVRPSELNVREVAKQDVATCSPHDEIHVAIQIMESSRVRRLPVVEEGRLRGIVSMTDILRHAVPLRSPEADALTCADAVGALKLINRNPRPRKTWVVAAE